MLGFHRRTRSLIPVKDLSKYEKLPVCVAEEVDECDDIMEPLAPAAVDRRQLILIYLIFVTEAIMASTLEPQLRDLLASNSCDIASTIYARSTLASAYAFGGLAGIRWGILADRIGRRPVAFVGLFGTAICCFSMVAASGVLMLTLLRFLAGIMSSAITVSAVCMLGDLTTKERMRERASAVAKLPLVGACGSLWPALMDLIAMQTGASDKPLINNQLVCGSLMLAIGVVAVRMLNETYPVLSQPLSPSLDEDYDSEKAAFLGQAVSMAVDPPSPSISVVDLSLDAMTTHISAMEFLKAPSLLSVLISLSLISLQTSTFESLFFQTGSSGPILACCLTGLPRLLFGLSAGILVSRIISSTVERAGLLRSLRYTSVFLPVLYAVTPILILLVIDDLSISTPLSSPLFFANSVLTHICTSLLVILLLNASPSPSSTGTIVGLTHFASLFKALGLASGSATYYVVDVLGGVLATIALWSSLVVMATVVIVVAFRVREGMVLDRDLDVDILGWEVAFEYDVDEKGVV